MHDTQSTSDTATTVVRANHLPWARVDVAVLRDSRLSHGARLLYAVLSSYADARGTERTPYPRQESLAEDMGCSERQVRRYVDELASAGLLTAARRTRPDGMLGGNVYTLHDPSTGQDTHVRSDRTPMSSSDRTPMSSPYLETVELETELLSASPTPKRRAPVKPIPDTWEPNPAHKERALERGVDVPFEAEQFRNHAQSVGRRCVDWDAAFRNWLLKAKPRPKSTWDVPPRSPAPPTGDPGDYVKEREAIIAREKAQAAAYEEANRGRFADVLRGAR